MKRHNGLLTLEDLRGYVAKERQPLPATIAVTSDFDAAASSGGAVPSRCSTSWKL